MACMALASCGSGNEAPPTGQVVARAAGSEITATELNLEMPPLPGGTTGTSELRDQALEGLISRKILADYARETGLDKTPEAAMILQRSNELALAQLVEASLRKNAPPVSSDEVAQFVAANPANFAQRKLLSVDQIVVPPTAPALAKQLQSFENFQQVKDLLDRNRIRYVRTAAVMDTLNLEPDVADETSRLKEGSLLMSPSVDGGFIMSIITAIRSEPMENSGAIQVGRAILTAQRGNQQTRNGLAAIIKREMPKVMINPAYAPRRAKAGQSRPVPVAGNPTGEEN